MGMIRLQLQLFTTNILGCILPLPGKGINGASALHRQSLTQIGLGIFGVIVQNIFKEAKTLIFNIFKNIIFSLMVGWLIG